MAQTPPPGGSHQIPVRALVTIMLALALAVSTIWIGLERIIDPELIDPVVPVVTESAPASPAVEGTPPTAGTPTGDEPMYRAGSLPDLLAYAPDRLADGSLPLDDVASYADIATWMAAVGVATPVDQADPGFRAWEAELRHLALPASLVERGLDPVWRTTYGFSLLQVQQVLVVGQAPDFVLVIRGSWEPADLQDAWVASGYQAVEVNGATVWSLSPADTIDLSSQASRPAMGALNNVTLLDDGTLVAAARISRMGPLLGAANGGPALIDRPEFEAIFPPGSGRDELVSAVISKGSLLERVDVDESGASPGATPTATPSSPGVLDTIRQRVESSAMPAAELVLIGIYPAVNPVQSTPAAVEAAGLMEMVIVYESSEAAEVAARDIERRLVIGRSDVTGRSWSERLGDPVVTLGRGDAADTTVEIDATLRFGRDDWLAMLGSRDLGFAAWETAST